jgi:hypothetical protein
MISQVPALRGVRTVPDTVQIEVLRLVYVTAPEMTGVLGVWV